MTDGNRVFNPKFLGNLYSQTVRAVPHPAPEPLRVEADGLVAIPGFRLTVLPDWAEAMGYIVERESK